MTEKTSELKFCPERALMKEIQKEKDRLIKERKIKKEKPLPEITEDELPFDIPENWCWVRLGDQVRIFAGVSFESTDFSTMETGAKVIKITNCGVGKFIETKEYLPADFLQRFPEYLVNENDIILTLTRPFIDEGLKVSLVTKEYSGALLNQRVAAIVNDFRINMKYLFYYLRSPFVLQKFKSRFSKNSGLQPNLKMSDLTLLEFPFPPLLEQGRIVQRLEELLPEIAKLQTNEIQV
jgi:type I restriction enzyme, S subunit